MKELEFKAQLAHDGSATRKISDFHNVKELYQKLADAFSVNRNEVSIDTCHATLLFLFVRFHFVLIIYFLFLVILRKIFAT